jgi:ribulose-5-phosphate 4-epimerase/fuculose-1-phosphate aldolase
MAQRRIEKAMSETALRDKLATATRILSMQGLLGLFGHISVYDPERKRVFMSPGAGSDKATVQASDILIADLNGRVLEGEVSLPIEWPIHTTLHATRSDALSVFHLHSPYATLFTIARREFHPVTLQGTMFSAGVPLHGEAELVKTQEHGRRLARLIGPKRAALLRGHGIVVAGKDIEETLYASLILEDDARKAMQAAALGELRTFTPEECKNFNAENDLPRRARRAWLYLEKLESRWDRQPGTGQAPLA